MFEWSQTMLWFAVSILLSAAYGALTMAVIVLLLVHEGEQTSAFCLRARILADQALRNGELIEHVAEAKHLIRALGVPWRRFRLAVVDRRALAAITRAVPR